MFGFVVKYYMSPFSLEEAAAVLYMDVLDKHRRMLRHLNSL